MMDFGQAEDKFRQLKVQFEERELTETEFKTQLEELMVQDEGGSWWMIGYETEQWYRHDGTEWVQTDLPHSQLQNRIQMSSPPERVGNEGIENVARETEILGGTRAVTPKNTEENNVVRYDLTDVFFWIIGGIVGFVIGLAIGDIGWAVFLFMIGLFIGFFISPNLKNRKL